jgi:GNAT superfamily N-acetyltransferase
LGKIIIEKAGMIKDVKIDENKVGYIEYSLQHTLEGKSIYIDFFYLEEGYRGKGLLKILLKTIIAIGKRRRIYIFYLIPTSDWLIQVYQRYGFVGERGLMRMEV